MICLKLAKYTWYMAEFNTTSQRCHHRQCFVKGINPQISTHFRLGRNPKYIAHNLRIISITVVSSSSKRTITLAC